MNFTCRWGRAKRFFSYFYAVELQKHKARSAEPRRERSTPDTAPCKKNPKKSIIKKKEAISPFPYRKLPHSPCVTLGRRLTISALGSYSQKIRTCPFFPSCVTLTWFSAAGAGARSLFGICAVSSRCKLIWYVSTTVVQTITNCGNDG